MLTPDGMFVYDLRLGLPHTNRNNLAEHLLLMTAGHYQWTSIASTIGMPLSGLRTLDGGEVYATFFYIEERFPDDSLINTFVLDDDLRFLNVLRAFKNISVEGQFVFDRVERLGMPVPAGDGHPFSNGFRQQHPYIRFGNILISPNGGNANLKVAPPSNGDFSRFAALPNEENPYHLVREARSQSTLGLLAEAGEWTPLDKREDFVTSYAIDPDRDTNGAGLVYFCQYVAFMDRAEREAMTENSARAFSREEISLRTLKSRRLAYYGNVDVSDVLEIRVKIWQNTRGDLGFRYAIIRQSDGEFICLSEAIKRFNPWPHRGVHLDSH